MLVGAEGVNNTVPQTIFLFFRYALHTFCLQLLRDHMVVKQREFAALILGSAKHACDTAPILPERASVIFSRNG